MKLDNKIFQWLISDDVSIKYQAYRDLLDEEKPLLHKKIFKEGWGYKLLSLRKNNGHWGKGFYQPKWTSTHYTLLDLKNLAILPNEQIKETVSIILNENKAEDGGIHPIGTIKKSDVCINGMFLNYASYFKTDENNLKSIVDFLLSEHMQDGGFNCLSNRKGAVHSSLHTTISVIEGINEYRRSGYKYRLSELNIAELKSREFILQHKLYLSDRTGEVIKKQMIMLSYPPRWYYDILRALDYFQSASVKYDERMEPAIKIILDKRRSEKLWPLQAKHPGETHFEMEPTGKPSRLNTLRALRVLKHFDIDC